MELSAKQGFVGKLKMIISNSLNILHFWLFTWALSFCPSSMFSHYLCQFSDDVPSKYHSVTTAILFNTGQ